MKNKDILIGILVALTLAAFSFLASTCPDGLERVACDKNFLSGARVFFKSPIPDYLVPGVRNEKIATALAGIFGVLVIYFLGLGLAKLLIHRK
jgi:cobalt/nickel transport protein